MPGGGFDLMDPEVHADPYPAYAWLREHSPVYKLANAPMYVVSRFDAGYGIGGTLSSTYAYVGAKVDLDGPSVFRAYAQQVGDLRFGEPPRHTDDT